MSGRLNMVRFMDFQVSNVCRRLGIAAKSWNKSTYACWAAFCLFGGPPRAGLSKTECVCACKVMDDYRLGLPRPELDSSPSTRPHTNSQCPLLHVQKSHLYPFETNEREQNWDINYQTGLPAKPAVINYSNQASIHHTFPPCLRVKGEIWNEGRGFASIFAKR